GQLNRVEEGGWRLLDLGKVRDGIAVLVGDRLGAVLDGVDGRRDGSGIGLGRRLLPAASREGQRHRQRGREPECPDRHWCPSARERTAAPQLTISLCRRVRNSSRIDQTGEEFEPPPPIATT